MKRKRTPKHRTTLYLPLELIDKLETYAEENGKTMTEAIEEAIRELLKREGYLNEKNEKQEG